MLDIIQHGDIHELHLAHAPVNALNPALVRQLRQAVELASAQGARAVMLSGSAGIFSAGLDLPALLPLDRTGMTLMWREFFALCGALAKSPIPIAAAITGHSPAGGAVLAILCDYRVMASGAFKIGLNEVQVGLAVPESIQMALRRIVGAYRAERLVISGAMIDAQEALRIGFVDELVEPERVVARTREWLQGLLELPSQAMAQTRGVARADLAKVFADTDAFPIAAYVDSWFAPESQATLNALVAKLKAPKAR